MQRSHDNHQQICHKRHGRKQCSKELFFIHLPPALCHCHRNGKCNTKTHHSVADVKHTNDGNCFRIKKALQIWQYTKSQVISGTVDEKKGTFCTSHFSCQQKYQTYDSKICQKTQTNGYQMCFAQCQRRKIMNDGHRQCNFQHQVCQNSTIL